MSAFVRRCLVSLIAIFVAYPHAIAEAVASSLGEIQIRGTVVACRSHWTGDGARIVTESRIRRADGSEIEVRQLGGTVDGVGMRVLHAPPLLAVGDQVSVRAGKRPARPEAEPWAVREVVQLTPKAVGGGNDGPSNLGYVRTLNAVGAPLYWKSGCVFIAYDSAGTSHLPGDQEFGILDSVFARWRNDTGSCAYLTFVAKEREEREVGFDRVNVVKFREDRWCRPATEDEPEECYEASAAALTTLFFVEDADSSRNGEILDADIELNGRHFAISDQGYTLGTASCLSDLASTVAHEVGHLMGLDHTCWTGEGERPTDDEGNPVPSCSSPLPAEVTEATMYNFQECGEVKKSSPEPDDIAGVCAIYPLANDPQECKEVAGNSRGCCAAAPGGRSQRASAAKPPLLLVAALVLALGATRCPRRRLRRSR